MEAVMSVLLASGNTVIVDQDLRDQAEALVNEQQDRMIRRVGIVNDDGSEVDLSPALAEFIRHVLEGLSRGPVSITTLPEELTTTTAAEMLAISRPTLMKWISNGVLPSYKVGSHSRLRTSDVLAYRAEVRARRSSAFDDLRAFEDALATVESP